MTRHSALAAARSLWRRLRPPSPSSEPPAPHLTPACALLHSCAPACEVATGALRQSPVMLFDPRHLAQRLAAEAAIGVCLLAGACYAGTRAAWGQALETPPVPAGGHPLDTLSALAGGGSVGALVVGIVAVLWLLHKLKVPLPRISIGGSSPAADEESSAVVRASAADVARLQEDVRQLERAGHERDKRISLVASGLDRLEASIKEVRDLLHDILVRRLGKGS